MDRYQIAIEKIKEQNFRFPATRSTAKIIQYIDYCLEHNGSFKADNIPVASLEVALFKVSQRDRAPIMVQTKENARILSTVYSSMVYSLDSPPHPFLDFIFYNCLPPKNLKVYFSVIL